MIIYCDGGARGNPGQAAYGFVIFDDEGNKEYEEGKKIGHQTNNYAEYMAVVSALRWITALKKLPTALSFFLDSTLVVNQMNGTFKIKNEGLRSLYFTAKTIEKSLNLKTTYTSVPREKNKEADRMVNLALDGLV